MSQRQKIIFLGTGGGGGAATSLAVTGTQFFTYPTATGSGTASITLTVSLPGEKFTMPASAATAAFSGSMSTGQEYVMEITGDASTSRVLTLPAGTFFDVNGQTTITTITIGQSAKESVRIRCTSAGVYLVFGVPPATAPTGTGAQVLANTPTLITPVLGAATATTINGQTIATNTVYNGPGFTVDGGGAAIVTGKVKGFITWPWAGTITGWNITVDTGTATIKVWKIATGTAKPTSANSINTSGVAISSGTSVHSTTVTDFTSTTVAAHDIFGFNIEAISGPTELAFNLQMTRSAL